MGKCGFLNHSIIAHRGIYNNITIFENTIESIMYAVNNNISVEIDIRLTKDEKIVVFHDDDCTRLLKLKDKINSLTKEELDYISPFYIPTLEDALNRVNGKVPIIIDIKDDNKTIKKSVNYLLKSYKGEVAIQSFNYDIVKFFKKKKFIVGLLIADKKNKSFLSRMVNIDYMAIECSLIDKIQSNLLKESYYIIGWTVNNREDVEKYIRIYNNLIIDNIEEIFV